MITNDLFVRFGAALLIGMLIGMQREYAKGIKKKGFFAGIRTYSLMALLGASAALMADIYQSPLIFLGLTGILGLAVVIAYYVGATEREEVGITSEVAAILTVIIGGLCYAHSVVFAIALGVAVTVMLAVKWEFHHFVKAITEEDIFATLQFAVITAIVLPILPNETYGPPPLNVLNPFTIWQLVVFISGINFLGYILIKVVGPKRGIGLSGLLGGLASSTANTLSFSQRSNRQKGLDRPFAVAIIAGWTIMFLRVIVEVAVVNPALVSQVWLAMLTMSAAGAVYAVYLFFTQKAIDEEEYELSNPFQLGPAVKFGLVFALILLITKAADVYLGEQGLYVSSFLAGLADVDAITLSIADLTRSGKEVSLVVGQRAIILAAIANTAAKGVLVSTLGSKQLRRAIWPALVLILLIGGGFLFIG